MDGVFKAVARAMLATVGLVCGIVFIGTVAAALRHSLGAI